MYAFPPDSEMERREREGEVEEEGGGRGHLLEKKAVTTTLPTTTHGLRTDTGYSDRVQDKSTWSILIKNTLQNYHFCESLLGVVNLGLSVALISNASKAGAVTSADVIGDRSGIFCPENTVVEANSPVL